MTPIDSSGARQLLEATIAAFSILGGSMAYCSGFLAARALVEQEDAEVLAYRINEGIGTGFLWGAPIAILALIIVVWS